MSGLAARLLPYLSYFLYFQLILICLALLVGAVMLLRYLLKKQPFDGDPAFTREKIAFELTSEINRMRDLRNRVFPGFEESGAITIQAGATPEQLAAMKAEERANADKDADKKYRERLDYLEMKNTDLEAQLKAGTGNSGDAAAIAKLSAENGEFETERILFKTKIEVLEKTLTEYQIFENDIALVKKYKAENEELRRQLNAAPQVTEEDIASLFSAMNVPPPSGGSSPAKAAGETAAKPAFAPPQAPKTIDPMDSLDDLLKAADQEATAGGINEAADASVVTEKFSEPAVSTETATHSNLDAEDLEALAETDKHSDDQLMAEFQKILGDKS